MNETWYHFAMSCLEDATCTNIVSDNRQSVDMSVAISLWVPIIPHTSLFN